MFTKIKIRPKNQEITLHWTKASPAGEPDKHTMECHDKPGQTFVDAFLDLESNFLEIMQLPSTYGTGLVVSGVTFGTTSDGEPYHLLTAQKRLEGFDAPVSMNTPVLMSITGNLEAKLVILTNEAVDYRAGKRSQLDLFQTGAGDDAAAALALEPSSN